MERHGRRPHGLSDPACLQERQVVVVGSLPELHGNWDVPRTFDGSPDDGFEQARLQRDGRSTAPPGHLGHGTAEVHIDVVDPSLADQHVHSPADAVRLGSVQLDAPRRLLGGEVGQAGRLEVAVDQAPGRDHLADVQASTELSAHGAKRGVGDPGHRRQNHGRPHLQRTDAGHSELAGSGQPDVPVHLAAQAHGFKATGRPAVARSRVH